MPNDKAGAMVCSNAGHLAGLILANLIYGRDSPVSLDPFRPRRNQFEIYGRTLPHVPSRSLLNLLVF